MNESIVKEKLQSFDYYINKLPLYLRNSYGIIDQFRMWFDVLKNFVTSSDELLSLLNIFDENYLDKENISDILNKLGSLFSIERSFYVTYFDQEQDTDVTEILTLNDEEMLLLIKAKIIQSHFDGTREQILSLYELLGLKVYYITSNGYANCDVYLSIIEDSDYDYSSNIQKMFLAKMLSLESMGINYSYLVINLNDVLIWDKAIIQGVYTGWDGGKWSL